MLIVDAHLDLAYNASEGRAVLRPAREQTADILGIPTVGLPDLRTGGVGLICATIFCEPDTGRDRGYQSLQEAAAMGWSQLQWYQQCFEADELKPVLNRQDLPPIDAVPGVIHAIILMEGADPIQQPEELPQWHAAGVRMIGMAWQQTRYAGGTGAPGPLTPEGRRLAAAMDELKMIHDVSHLAEASFWELLDLSDGPICATHSNCRAIVPTDRQLSDAMIRAIANRGGVIGINFFDRFLIPPEQFPRRATLADVIHHIRHICDITGNARHVGIGTDMDGGLGREQIPTEITTSADLPRLADALSQAGFSDTDIGRIMAENWHHFFATHLPPSA